MTLVLTNERFVGEALADQLRDNVVKALCIGQRLARRFVLAKVETERLFVNVAEQVERLDRNISSFETPFQETPEIFASVGMNFPVDITLRMIYYHVSEFVKPVVRLQFVAVDRRSGF